MQKKTIFRIIGGAGVAALIALGAAISIPELNAAAQDQQAQPNAGPGFRGPRMGRMGHGGMMGGRPGAFGLAPRDLTDAQREQIKTVRENHAAEIKPLAERVAKARQALADAVSKGGDLRAPSIELGSAEGELALATAQLRVDELAVLTSEQRQKIQDRQKEMEARRAEFQKRRQAQGSGNRK